MAEFKIGTSPLTNRIYAGKVLNDGTWGANKKDVTDTAPTAVAQYLIQTNSKIIFSDIYGEEYCLRVEKSSITNMKQ